MTATDNTNTDVDQKISALAKTIPKLHWGRLRFLGNLRTLAVSSLVGLALALPNLVGTDIKGYLKNPVIIQLVVVFLVGMSLAYLSYELFCPVIVKRFVNLPDFYQHQLNIKKLQLETYPSDPFTADLLHVAEHYIKALGQFPVARYITLTFYIISFIAFILLLVQIYIVL